MMNFKIVWIWVDVHEEPITFLADGDDRITTVKAATGVMPQKRHSIDNDSSSFLFEPCHCKMFNAIGLVASQSASANRPSNSQ
jgi:hypothetical protein